MAVAQVGIGQQLVKELRAQVTLLEADLLARSTDVAAFAETLRAEYDAARDAGRTAAGFTEWRCGRITQSAAAWVLGTVFVRFCEDNGLIEWPFVAGLGERLADAEDRHGRFFVENPTLNDRDWLIAAFRHLSAAHPTAAGLFDERHNPLWELTPSFEAATALIKFWRRSDDAGAIRHDFTSLDTRFLGDLYQDLSEAARKTYALLAEAAHDDERVRELAPVLGGIRRQAVALIAEAGRLAAVSAPTPHPSVVEPTVAPPVRLPDPAPPAVDQPVAAPGRARRVVRGSEIEAALRELSEDLRAKARTQPTARFELTWGALADGEADNPPEVP